MTRFLILGAGGVGGVVGGRLFQHGHDVVLVARGAHLEAIRTAGLRVDDPDGSVTLAVPAVGHVGDAAPRADDVVILATKTQDAGVALDQLRDVAPPDVAVACATNGVEAERLALRRFSHVYGISVVMPTGFPEPGVVHVVSAPIGGSLDVGRFPAGVDDRAVAIATALSASQFVSEARPDIARFKYRKLVLNTANAVEAACGRAVRGTPNGDAALELARRAKGEAESVYAAAGFEVADDREETAKRDLLTFRPVPGHERGGGSTWQSLARHGSVETDYLNGEIVLLGRLHGVATPVNALLQRVLHELARTATGPGALDATDLLARLG